MKLKFFVVLLMVALGSVKLMAQGQFEYGAVVYDFVGGGSPKYRILSSIGETLKVLEEGKNTEGYGISNLIPVNKYLNELAKQGWEVYNTTSSQYNLTFYLRRKLQ